MVVLPCKIGIGIPLESHHDWQHSPGSSCCYFSNDFLVLKNLLRADIPELKNTHVSYLLEASHASLCSKTYMYRCLCKNVIAEWAILENIHTQPRMASMFNLPPPCLPKFQNVLPHYAPRIQ